MMPQLQPGIKEEGGVKRRERGGKGNMTLIGNYLKVVGNSASGFPPS